MGAVLSSSTSEIIRNRINENTLYTYYVLFQFKNVFCENCQRLVCIEMACIRVRVRNRFLLFDLYCIFVSCMSILLVHAVPSFGRSYDPNQWVGRMPTSHAHLAHDFTDRHHHLVVENCYDFVGVTARNVKFRYFNCTTSLLNFIIVVSSMTYT